MWFRKKDRAKLAELHESIAFGQKEISKQRELNKQSEAIVSSAWKRFFEDQDRFYGDTQRMHQLLLEKLEGLEKRMNSHCPCCTAINEKLGCIASEQATSFGEVMSELKRGKKDEGTTESKPGCRFHGSRG